MSKKLRLILIFFFSLTIFAIMQSNSYFPDPDSFYHAKIAKIMADGDIVIKDFPWLPHTTLQEHYVDHHFLYHLFLVPFVKISPLIGIKVATAVLGAAFVTLFAAILFSLGVAMPEFFILILLTNLRFMVRANLPKGTVFSLIFLFVGIWSIIKDKKGLLFLTSFFYVWAYGGWEILPFITGIFWISNPTKKSFDILVSALAGSLAGLILNFYFPTNFYFLYDQFIKIGVVGYGDILNVGEEWHPTPIIDLIKTNAVVIELLILAAIYPFLINKKIRRENIPLLLSTIFFMLLTIRSKRYIEYFIPLSILFIAIAFKDFGIDWLKNTFLKTKNRELLPTIATTIIITFGVIGIVSLFSLKRTLNSGFRLDYMQQESLWLSKNTKPMSIIFHSSWGEFPALFYYNSTNRYIGGLDPTFSYLANEEKYFIWQNISQGNFLGNPRETIKDRFDSDLVLIDKRHTKMTDDFKQNGYQVLFTGKDAQIVK